MGIFDRMGRVISSNVNSLLDRAEDPKKLLELNLADMDEQLKRGQEEVIAAVAGEKQLRKKVDELTSEQAKWEKRAELALKSGDEALAREPYERVEGSPKRNGFKLVSLPGLWGRMTLRRPVVRAGTLRLRLLEALKAGGRRLRDVLAVRFWLRGASTAAVAEELREVIGARMSKSTVSTLSNALEPVIRDWETRPVPADIRYLFLDALYLPVRRPGFTKDQALLLALGVDSQDRRHVLAFALGDRESKDSWTSLLKDLLARGLDRALAALQAILAEPAANRGRAAERVRFIVRRVAETACSLLPELTVLFRVKATSPATESAVERRRAFDRAVARLIAEGQADGELSTAIEPGLATRLIFGTSNSIVEWYRPGGALKPAQLAAAIEALLFEGLGPAKS